MYKLSKDKYGVLLDHLLTIPFNTLLAHSVVYGYADGAIYVDNVENPQTYYIIHSYGMTWLAGNSGNEAFNNRLRAYFQEKSFYRKKDEWLQTYPRSWDTFMDRLIEENIAISSTRVNLKFDKAKFFENYSGLEKANYKVIATTIEMLFEMNGSVVAKDYWISSKKYSEIAKAFSVIIDERPVSTAFTSARIGNKLEIGIETLEEFQGMGLAYLVCAKLIEYCIDNNLEPIWACRLENTGSLRLSKKLGFTEVLRTPYYHIPKLRLPKKHWE